VKLRRLRRRGGGVIDRRGQRGFGFGGGGFPVSTGGGVIGGGGIALVLLAIVIGLQFCGGEGGFGIPGLPGDLGGAQGAPSGQSGPAPTDDLGQFVDAVGDDVQIMWDRDIFEPAGRRYEYTEIVLFTQRTSSACGAASAGVGPFYCPADRLVYLEETFFRELARRFGAPGDFARAYVLAHEFGHHVQTLLGIEGDVRRQQRANPDDANELSVRLELQADCFAGVWANSVYDREAVNDADIEEGLNAAAAVGDDRLQQQGQGRVNPDTFTHGTSEQRTTWFRRGFASGDPEDCDTFNADV
jgi:predicted metalloprotease